MVARWLQQPQTLCTLNPKAWGKNRASASSNQMQALSLALAGSNQILLSNHLTTVTVVTGL